MRRLGKRQERIDATALANQVRDNLADIAQAQAEMGLTAIPDEAALAGKPAGAYRVLSTNERVYYDGAGNITARAPMAAADALTARVFRVPLQPGGDYATNAAVFNTIVALAPEGSTLEFPGPGQEYQLGRTATITKSLNINLNGTRLRVKPWDSSTVGSPVFHFRGALAPASHAITQGAQDTATLILAPGAGAAYAAGQYVEIRDNQAVPRWDGAGGYSGRAEPNRIRSVSGDTLTLEAPLEWTYAPASAQVQAFTPLTAPAVYGDGLISEVDPGAVWAGGGLTGSAPHIIHMQYSLNPYAADLTVQGWQLHVVNMDMCINPVWEGITARDPFRASNGGHGYLGRAQRCRGGSGSRSVSHGARHTVDWNQTYDFESWGNIALDGNGAGAAYQTHGLGSRRGSSNGDQALGDQIGWSAGNESFGADYAFRINAGVYRGRGEPVVAQTGTDVEVHNPDFVSSFRGVRQQTGAHLTIIGGRIDTTPSDQSYAPGVFQREKNPGDTGSLEAGNLTLQDVQITAKTGNAPVAVRSNGHVQITGGRLTGQNTVGVAVNASVTPASLIVRRTAFSGTLAAHVEALGDVTGELIVEGIIPSAQLTGNTLRLKPNGKTRVIGNLPVAGRDIQWGGDLEAAISAGALVFHNGSASDRLPRGQQAYDLIATALTINTANGGLDIKGAAGSNRGLGFYSGNTFQAAVRLGTTNNLEFALRQDNGAANYTVTWDRLSGRIDFGSAGEFLMAGTWDKPLRLGVWRIWVDQATGRLYNKNAAPTNATDGNPIG